MDLPKSVKDFFKRAGKQGGQARAKALSAAKRKKIAACAAKARWEKERKRP